MWFHSTIQGGSVHRNGQIEGLRRRKDMVHELGPVLVVDRSCQPVTHDVSNTV
jgi:hypothetical protein